MRHGSHEKAPGHIPSTKQSAQLNAAVIAMIAVVTVGVIITVPISRQHCVLAIYWACS